MRRDCTAMSTSMSVPEPPLLITRKVLEFGDEFEVGDEEEHADLMTSGNAQTVAQAT